MESVKVLSFHIQGTVPTLMHNGRLADPLDEKSILLKEITGKRKKTEADQMEMSRIEHEAGLYLNCKGRPYWPPMNIRAMIIAAAKKSKEGTIAKTAFAVAGDTELIYDGPKTVEGLWKNKTFVNRSRTKMGAGTSVMRTRPIFPQWELKFDIEYFPDQVSKKTVVDWVALAGRVIGLSDWRPQHGLFRVLGVEEDA